MNGSRAEGQDLDIQVSPRGKASVVTLRGEVDLRSSPQLRQALLELLEKRVSHVVVDLTNVSYMDSSGVGTLVELKRKAERSRGKVTLVGPQPRVRSVFEITQLDKFFNIVATLAEAGAG